MATCTALHRWTKFPSSYITTMIKLFQKTLLIILISLFPLNAMATNVTVEMLNKMGKESMVYSKK